MLGSIGHKGIHHHFKINAGKGFSYEVRIRRLVLDGVDGHEGDAIAAAAATALREMIAARGLPEGVEGQAGTRVGPDVVVPGAGASAAFGARIGGSVYEGMGG